MRHIVLFNGYSLAENPGLSGVTNQKGESVVGKFGDWEHVCTHISCEELAGGECHDTLGRIPTALMLAANLDAEYIIWSTGATWLPDGTSEAKYSFDHALKSLSRCTTGRSADWLCEISIIEDRSTNTMTSMQEAFKLIWPVDEPTMLHLVSSANHMPRVMRDAIKVFGKVSNVILSGVPAGTSYGGKGPEDVVIYELGEPPKEKFVFPSHYGY